MEIDIRYRSARSAERMNGPRPQVWLNGLGAKTAKGAGFIFRWLSLKVTDS